jgi:quinol monooxygenase YgiN
MYTATIIYEFKKGQFEKGLAIWKKIVLSAAQGQKGLMRMQLLEGPGKFMAQGTWQAEEFAQAFMRTGVFKALMEELRPLLVQEPRAEQWDLTEVLEGK